MKFTMTKIAALAAMTFASTGAHAVLTSSSILNIGGDAVTAQDTDGNWYVASDGPLQDSFFTMGGSKNKQSVNTQYAYLYNGFSLTLNGATQSNIDAFTFYGAFGSNETRGTGISILSASGDTATVDMSGWVVDWNGVQNIPMGTGAWSAGYTNGVGNITCDAGSGCAVGSAYTLKYTATVPLGEPSGFGGVKYYLELHGAMCLDCDYLVPTIPIPEASTYGMMMAGLGLVGLMARRRKQAAI
jgi:hypothetical protein